MLELTSEEWVWVVAALEHYRVCPELLWAEEEKAEIHTLFHKIKDADVWG